MGATKTGLRSFESKKLAHHLVVDFLTPLQAEIEAHLGLHPAVKLVLVVGVPDDRLEEVPAAFVELKPGRTATVEDLLEHCRGQIARFKVPRHIRFVNEWPMSATKVQKEPLRLRLIEELAGSAVSSGSPATTEGDRR